jgi:hypothetical protein
MVSRFSVVRADGSFAIKSTQVVGFLPRNGHQLGDILPMLVSARLCVYVIPLHGYP